MTNPGRLGTVGAVAGVLAVCVASVSGVGPPAHAADADGPSFQILAYPNTPWRYDAEIGQSYNPIWGSGAIVHGAFDSFQFQEPLNRYGTYGPAEGSYVNADVKIALFGSSFTAPETTLLFQRRLAARLGRSVHVVNFAIGATGILSMFDVARVKVPEFRPDVLLFTFNATQYLYPRLWRFNAPAAEHFWRFAQALEPRQTYDPRTVDLHPGMVITDLITADWVRAMERARKEGNTRRLRDDPLVRRMIAEYQRLQADREAALRAHGPVRIALAPEYSYAKDDRFRKAVEYVKGTRLPFFMIHLPTRPELEQAQPNRFAFPAVGVPEEQGRRYVAEVERLTGKPVIHLVDYYDPAKLKEPRKLVASDLDGHPGREGIPAMADAFVRLMLAKAPGIAGRSRAEP